MTKERHLFLSPHFDDAVWSCGGRIAHLTGQGDKVVVATVFSELLNEPISDSWRRVANYRFRAAENIAALRVLGAEGVNLGYIDAALRQNKDKEFIYPTLSSILCSECSAYDSVLPSIVEDIQSLLCSHWDSINIPIAIGSHIDHMLVRSATEQATQKSLTYYEDFPYIPEMNHPIGLTPYMFEITEECLYRWLEAGQLYRSQVLWLFNTRLAFREAITRRISNFHFFSDQYVERTWSISSL